MFGVGMIFLSLILRSKLGQCRTISTGIVIRIMNEEIIIAIIGSVTTIFVALITRGYIHRRSNLEKKVLKSLKDYYDKDPDALMPADDFIKALKLDSDTGDKILQRLRKKNLITTYSHPMSKQNLIKLTSKGVELSENLS